MQQDLPMAAPLVKTLRVFGKVLKVTSILHTYATLPATKFALSIELR